ncbi:MAG: T9SS type A sorting domain-containing protein [Candidatus Kapabacteria bacterium]|nr:T9SS type A sorting domain-containing protein [Candidatus Kapabacteria bacterium]
MNASWNECNQRISQGILCPASSSGDITSMTSSVYRIHGLAMITLCLLTAQTLLSQEYSVILGRPTDRSITASVYFAKPTEYYLEYGTLSGMYTQQSATVTSKAGESVKTDLVDLGPNTKYVYRVRYRAVGGTTFQPTPEYTFRTQRARGEAFTFLVEADEHLYDKKGIRSMYQITLENMKKDSADFMLSLGDTFGDDHEPTTTTSQDMDDLHRDYLQYLGSVCHSLPFYFCLGNHEGESGYYLKQNAPNNIAVWGTLWRKFYYANPFPNGFYTGNMTREANGIDHPENYYAWEWGDALFVVLDVYRDCDVNDKPQNWDWTLGETQYRWMRSALENSTAKYKFVFAHHTRGQGRGGVNTAKGAEWGGYNNKGVYEFDKFRPGWGLPIHQLMVKTGVNVFFQGHDHLYAKEELDGVVYQEVPMPSDSTYEIGVLANADAYTDVTMRGTGHLRISISDAGAVVDFVSALMPKDEVDGKKNGEILYSYTVKPRAVSVNDDVASGSAVAVAPNPAHDVINVLAPSTAALEVVITNVLGQVVARSGLTTIDVSQLPHGLYDVMTRLNGQETRQTIMIGGR